MTKLLVPVEKSKTKRRAHYGSVILSQRDLDSLLWMGAQFAIRFDHLQILAGRLPTSEGTHSSSRMHYKAVYRFSTRWVKADMVERKKIFVGQPMWLWLTSKGLQTIGLDHPYHVPAISRLAHIHAANAVRLHVEEKLGSQAKWIGERQANGFRKAEGKKHLVDGELEYADGHVVGIEVELTQKRRSRLDRILRELNRDYDSVWYFAADECFNAVQNALEKIPNYKETFILHRLSSIIKASE